ncbi:MAG: helix-turn-helix transcriptional regulator [Myxococcales bacterium]|nr:helix-turn-helix transcriptional regulator [Myxococcales bacterium]
MSNYRNETEQLAAAFSALGHPHRLALFRRLTSCCAPGTTWNASSRVCIADLTGMLDIAPSTLAHHLKVLRQAGLIASARRGKQVECWVDPNVLLNLSHFFLTPLSDATPIVDPAQGDHRHDH